MPFGQLMCVHRSTQEKEFAFKNYRNIIQMKSSKIYYNQLDMSQVIANILHKIYCPQYIPLVSMGLIKGTLMWI